MGMDLSLMQARMGSHVRRRPADHTQRVAPPSQADYIHARGSLEFVGPAGDPAAQNQVVVSYEVREGYMGLITHVLFAYSGPTPPVQGDPTSLVYALTVNGTPAHDFDTVITSLGSLTDGPYPVPGGLLLESRNVVEGLVSLPLGSTVAAGPGSFAHIFLIGFTWPIGSFPNG